MLNEYNTSTVSFALLISAIEISYPPMGSSVCIGSISTLIEEAEDDSVQFFHIYSSERRYYNKYYIRLKISNDMGTMANQY